MAEYHGNTLGEVVHKSLAREKNIRNKNVTSLSKKENFRIWAEGRRWGEWVGVFAQIGVIGPDADRNVTKKRITFRSLSHSPSSYSVQIKGGDKFIQTVGDNSTNSEIVTITGNVATQVSIRCKSHSIPQDIFVNVF